MIGAIDRWYERPHGLTQGFCCTPEACGPTECSLRCDHDCYSFESGWNDPLEAQLFRKGQTLPIESLCGCVVTLSSSNLSENDECLRDVSSNPLCPGEC